MSLVRDNLLTRPNYSPYCGNIDCPVGIPRTKFNGSQFECKCGWVSGFDDEFIAEYKEFRKTFEESK